MNRQGTAPLRACKTVLPIARATDGDEEKPPCPYGSEQGPLVFLFAAQSCGRSRDRHGIKSSWTTATLHRDTAASLCTSLRTSRFYNMYIFFKQQQSQILSSRPYHFRTTMVQNHDLSCSMMRQEWCVPRLRRG